MVRVLCGMFVAIIIIGGAGFAKQAAGQLARYVCNLRHFAGNGDGVPLDKSQQTQQNRQRA